MKYLLILSFTLVSSLFFSQTDSEYFFGKKKTVKAEVLFENGITKTGVLKNFKIFRRFDNINSLEKNLDSKEFEFKANDNNVVEIININDIKSITTFNDAGSEYIRLDKLKLKTVNSKHEIIDLNKTVLLPIVQEGNLNLYGFFRAFFDVGGVNQGYLATLFMPYLKHSNSEYAYLPFDYNRMNIFNVGKLEGKFKIALQEATKSCPEFQSNIDEIMKLFEKSNKENMKKQYYDKEAQKKQIRKDIKDKETELMLQIKVDEDYMVKPYLDLVNSYNLKCQK